ncbi:hypothetical protein [Petropleomorpha daqingensis]|uniref:Uncharacterized protein n=1 Tax=Petropleomorpha daqingensis TaxID=2026353 RepID=A0A853CL24_9ACTN|nr:hypothetical protein [Petropleomorpha daqingensis]NYJ07242.1 hypothetical protein [Petropleomorpha daqingensis]
MTLEPLGPDSVDLVASALTASADLSDVGMFVRVFTRSLADALPEGVVDVDHDRTMGDRLAGRPGTPTALRLTFPERRLSLTATRGWPEAEVQQVVRGVVLSRKQVPVEEWVRTLAAELTDLAARNASARAALAALLGSP